MTVGMIIHGVNVCLHNIDGSRFTGFIFMFNFRNATLKVDIFVYTFVLARIIIIWVCLDNLFYFLQTFILNIFRKRLNLRCLLCLIDCSGRIFWQLLLHELFWLVWLRILICDVKRMMICVVERIEWLCKTPGWTINLVVQRSIYIHLSLFHHLSWYGFCMLRNTLLYCK